MSVGIGRLNQLRQKETKGIEMHKEALLGHDGDDVYELEHGHF